MNEERLITVAIHTYENAVKLKNLLESEGVAVVLHNVNLSQPVVSSGVRVRIKECDLPLALRIIENREIFCYSKDVESEKAPEIVVPVDFSDYSTRAAMLAFDVASRHKAQIVFIHAYIIPYQPNLQLSNTYSYDVDNVQLDNAIVKEARLRMEQFGNSLKEKIKQGDISPVVFKTEIMEGIPEDVITEYSKNTSPLLIIMGTRGADKKERDLVGSVTAEVLDSCRFPAFTVPDSPTAPLSLSAIHSVVFFSNLDQEDIIALDTLHRLIPDLNLDITIVHIPGRKDRGQDCEKAYRSLLEYCNSHYGEAGYRFSIRKLELKSAIDDFNMLEKTQPINLIVVPNKKKNVFARLFNPGLAHKLLFHADIPIMAIPV